ncbi:MAG: sialate O-acetylesterase [Phycisphaerales bacterium]|jgi:sialate O-acetylesterase|nr:sialate O-acetylesterase [Phycisphaerales bacterium]
MMKIESGLWDHMVLQRNKRGVSEAKIIGRTIWRGDIVATVWKGNKPLRGWNQRKVGKAAGEKFSAILKGLETGGPYNIELSAGEDRLRVEDVLVGDVWILAGQSNMQGIAARTDAAQPHPQVRAFYMTDHWDKAQEPLHTLWKAVDPIHNTLHGQTTEDPIHVVGPGLYFALNMRRETQVPQGLIACAHGGSSMLHWDPALKRLEGKSLYGAMVRRVRKNGGKVAGVLWYQGESDALNFETQKYIQRMKKLVGSIRRDFNDAKLPMVMAQIGRFVVTYSVGDSWNEIQDQQRRMPKIIPHLAVVPTIDLPMEDPIHIGADGPKRLGARMARAMRAIKGDKKVGLPIELGAVTFKKRRPTGMLDVEIKFKNVRGGFRRDGYPMGFEVLSEGSIPVGYRTELLKDRVVIRTTTPYEQAKNVSIHYGRGLDPSVNVTDLSDQGIPAFRLNQPRLKVVTPFIQRLRVSDLMPSAGKLHDLDYPTDLSGLNLKTRMFSTEMIIVRPEFASRGSDDVLVWMVCGFYASEAMKLVMRAGPDGPIKMWIDGREILHYPQGINPAVADTAISDPFEVKEGKHELVIALGSNHGNAWGMFVRMQRLDLNAEELKNGPTACILPAWLG